MVKVMVFGSFDLFHKGHEFYFKQAKALGDELVVVIARDVSIERLKHHKPMFSERKRLNVVKASPFVDKAILGDKLDFYKVIDKELPDILCLGYDQSVKEETLLKALLQRGIDKIKVVRVKSHMPDVYKSSKLKISKNKD